MASLLHRTDRRDDTLATCACAWESVVVGGGREDIESGRSEE